MKLIHIEILEGLGDDQTSPGMLTIAAELRKLPGATVIVRHWNQWQDAANALRALPATTLRSVIGYSNGASEVTQIAAENIPIDLLISLDPTIWLACAALHGNVKQAICFHNVNPASSFPPVGHASLTTAPDFKGTLRTVDTWDMHINVDTDPAIQGAVILAERQLAQGS